MSTEAPVMPSKPKAIMQIDSTCRKTHWVPIHPETGEVWKEKHEELGYAAFMAAYDGDEETRAEHHAEYERLAEGVEMREQPFFCEHTYIFGQNSVKAGFTKPPLTLGCHPETWALLTDEQKASFEPFDVDEWRRGLDMLPSGGR